MNNMIRRLMHHVPHLHPAILFASAGATSIGHQAELVWVAATVLLLANHMAAATAAAGATVPNTVASANVAAVRAQMLAVAHNPSVGQRVELESRGVMALPQSPTTAAASAAVAATALSTVVNAHVVVMR